MIYTIENAELSVSVETLGAQLASIKSKKDGTEYLWQGDEKYWTGRAPNLFPIVGRLVNGSYTYKGVTYNMKPHGFAKFSEFTLIKKQKSKMTFGISASDETLKQYPFEFLFKINYSLEGKRLDITYEVENIGSENMLFGLGAHPGINVPFGGGNFEDYYIEFSEKCEPKRLLLSENYMMSGEEESYKLKEGRKLPLHHDLFDNDAVILRNAAKSLTIKSKMTEKSVTVEYPNMKYIAFWHAVKTDAPYVCIEPWENLPSYDGKVEAFEEKPDFKTLVPKHKYESMVSIIVNN